MKNGYYEVNDMINGLARKHDIAKEKQEEILKKYKDKMSETKDKDEESGHIEANGVLCDLLDELGYGEITEIFNDLDKWYS